MFPRAQSYTGEEVVELSVHGGEAITKELLTACYDVGAAPAAAGEFTRRAFLNGRISLTQAEAVMEMIEATGEAGARAAAAAMQGALYRKISGGGGATYRAGRAHCRIYRLPGRRRGRAVRHSAVCHPCPPRAASWKSCLPIMRAAAFCAAGFARPLWVAPTWGKSTLLNLMSGVEKAIVTPIAGTTRDVVEQDISLAGTTLLLADTAGLRDTQDPVEAEGIRRSQQKLEEANLILAVFDASRPLTGDDLALAQRCRGRLAIAISNKNRPAPRRPISPPLRLVFMRW